MKVQLCFSALAAFLQAVAAQSRFLLNRRLAALLEWPMEDATAGDRIFSIDVQKASGDCFGCYFDGDEEVGPEFQFPGTISNHWNRGVECGLLRGISEKEFRHMLRSSNATRLAVLWESEAFASEEHSLKGFRDFVEFAISKNARANAVLYVYTGWEPESEFVRSWWKNQHRNPREWQTTPSSFGGWGRSTLTLVESGRIIWDVFDLVLSSRHESFRKNLSAAELDMLQLEGPNLSLRQALEALNTHINELSKIPVHLCFEIAKNVIPQAELMSDENIEVILDVCEQNHDLHHRGLFGLIDYEVFHSMAVSMGLVSNEETVKSHAEKIWRSTLSFLHHESRKADVSVMISIVPGFAEGISSKGFGFGDAEDALLFSICYYNGSVPEDLSKLYQTKGSERKSLLNTDVYLALIRCELGAEEILECIKGVLADLREASLDLEAFNVKLSNVIFGAGIAGKTQYKALEEFWSDDHGLKGPGRFPEKSTTEEFTSEMQRRRNKLYAEKIERDEL